MLTLLHHTTEVYPCQFSLLEALLEVYKNFKRYFATATTQTTQSGCCGTAVRPTCFCQLYVKMGSGPLCVKR